MRLSRSMQSSLKVKKDLLQQSRADVNRTLSTASQMSLRLRDDLGFIKNGMDASRDRFVLQVEEGLRAKRTGMDDMRGNGDGYPEGMPIEMIEEAEGLHLSAVDRLSRRNKTDKELMEEDQARKQSVILRFLRSQGQDAGATNEAAAPVVKRSKSEAERKEDDLLNE